MTVYGFLLTLTDRSLRLHLPVADANSPRGAYDGRADCAPSPADRRQVDAANACDWCRLRSKWGGVLSRRSRRASERNRPHRPDSVVSADFTHPPSGIDAGRWNDRLVSDVGL